METLVFTTKGLVPRSALTARDVVTEDANGRTVVTEWYLGEELVRRSVWLDLYRPMDLSSNGS